MIFNGKFKMFVIVFILILGLYVLSNSVKILASEEPVTITFYNWVSIEEGTRDQIKAVIKQFETENPNIRVDVKPVQVSDILNQLMIMSIAGNVPDIAQVHPEDVITLASSGVLAPTDNILSSGFKQDLQQSLYNLTVYQGEHYGIPWAPAGPGFLYNKKLMKQAGLDPNSPPETIQEFTDYLEIAKKKLPENVVLFQIDTTIRTIGLMHEWPIMRAFGALPIDGDKVQINTPEMKRYCEWLRNAMNEGYTLPGKKYGEFRPLAAQGRLMFMMDGSYIKGVIKSLNDSITDEKFYETWGVAAIPGNEEGKHFAVPDDHFLIVFKDSKHKEAAAKFAEYLVNSNYALKNYYAPIGFVPATKSAVDRVPEIGNDPIRRAYIEKIIPTVVPLPYGPTYADVATTIMTGIQEIITTDKPIPEILSKYQSQVEDIINEY